MLEGRQLEDGGPRAVAPGTANDWTGQYLIINELDRLLMKIVVGDRNQPVEAGGHACGRCDSVTSTPRVNGAALDAQLRTVYLRVPWGSLAPVSAPEGGSKPGR